jgi:hypothetical protein
MNSTFLLNQSSLLSAVHEVRRFVNAVLRPSSLLLTMDFKINAPFFYSEETIRHRCQQSVKKTLTLKLLVCFLSRHYIKAATISRHRRQLVSLTSIRVLPRQAIYRCNYNE